MTELTADEIAAVLDLKPHPDGGRYRETFRDETAVTAFRLFAAGEQLAWSALADTVEVWQFYDGAPLRLQLAAIEGGAISSEHLSRAGAQTRSQLGVPSGWWRSAESTGDWSLVGVTAAPASELPEALSPG